MEAGQPQRDCPYVWVLYVGAILYGGTEAGGKIPENLWFST